MSSGSMTKPIGGFLAGAIQMQVPIVNGREDVDLQLKKIVNMVYSMKAGYPGLELIVFPEYSLQGLNTKLWLSDEILCDIPGKETDALAKACKDNKIYGVFSILERGKNGKNPYNTAIIIDPNGKIILKYHKVFPWTPIEPWEPGDEIPVCDGPEGSKLAVCICHDGMIPELAREAAYKGANVYIRISGYSTQVNDQWMLTNRTNAYQNLMWTFSVNLAGYDGTFYYFGEGQLCDFNGNTLAQGHRNPNEIVTGEIYPSLADNARISYGLENNIYNLGSRGNVAIKGGAKNPHFTYMEDLVRGEYKLPWEDKIQIKDGSIYGYPAPREEH